MADKKRRLLLSEKSVTFNFLLNLRGDKLNYKSVAKEISKPPFLAPEVQWASKFAVFVRSTFRTMPIFGMSRDHNRKRLKIRTEWIIFEM